MRNALVSLLILALVGGVFATDLPSKTARVPIGLVKNYEPQGEEIPPMNLGAPNTGLREANGVLVDSSMNGYGLLAPETDPIGVYGDNVFLAYRQYTGAAGGSGVMGAAYSDDGGQTFSTYSDINFGGSDAGARYPSALATADVPVVIWTESGDNGGGDYGGRARYSFDEGWYGGGLFLPLTDIHNNPAANDTWMGKVTFNEDADGNLIFNTVWSDWSGDRHKLHMRSATDGAWFGTPLTWENSWSIIESDRVFEPATETGSTTAEGDLDINENGIGYMVLAASWQDTLSIANHTLFIKRTDDYGATWSGLYYLADAPMNNYFWDVFPDSLQDEETGEWTVLADGWGPFVNYELDVLVDDEGNCHMFAGVLPSAGGYVYPGWSEYNGLYHFKVDNDAFTGNSGPLAPEINFISSLQLHWLLSAFADPAWQANCYTAALDQTLDDHLYVIFHHVGDTTMDVDGSITGAWLDLFGYYSPDGGDNWYGGNITQTSDDYLDETDPHVFKYADNGSVKLMYQIPDWDNPTAADPPEQMEDCFQYVYFWDYTFEFQPAEVAVTFSVDMSFQEALGNFDPENDIVDVAGSFNGWGATVSLLSDDDSDGIYEGTFNVPIGAIEYKFRINSNWDTSENIDNRTADISGETVLPTVWYGNQEPVELTNVEVQIFVDMTVQILAGNFDPENDLITVRGSHENYGNWGGSVALELDPELANVYTQLAQFDDVPEGSGYEYKFVILPGGDPDSPVWESSPNRSWVATGDEADVDENGYGEIIEPVYYFADVSPEDIVTQDVTVTFTVDISPAFWALSAGDTLYDTQTESDGISDWSEVNGVCINGVLGQWWDWGNDLTCEGDWALTALDDPSNDYLYTFEYLFTAGQAKAQTYKYGLNSLDNEAGFDMNREVLIDDAATTFAAPTDCFGSQNTDESIPFPRPCDGTDIAGEGVVPAEFTLNQNFPNPFNPSTTIAFSIPEASAVSLRVFDLTGREVAQLQNGYLPAGNHQLTFDGSQLASGMYLYQLEANGQTAVNKMMLLK